MRTVCTSVMAVLVVVALFWGNCFSCPQVLLSSAQHGCCHRTKAHKTDCNNQGLQNFVKAEKAAPVSSLPVTTALAAPLPEFASISAGVLPVVLFSSSPPLTSLRI